MRRISAVLLIVCALAGAALLAIPGPAAAQDAGPVVDVAEVFGVLDGQLAGFLVDRIADANRRGIALLVLEIDTPGALEVDVEKIVSRIESSRVPIAVWVGPRRARARSAGALIVTAAHVSAIGPSATLGPLHPIELTIDPRSPEGRRGRTTELARAEGLASERRRKDPSLFLDRSLGANASLDAGAVDFVVPSVAELLKRANGRTLTTAAGSVTLDLPSDQTVIRFLKPGPIRGMLHTLATPALAYILLLAGAMLVTFELFQPGFGIAGITGAFLLAGAVYGLTVLPVGLLGLTVLIVGLALLALDVAVHGLGVPTAVGTVLFVYGSLSMFPAPAGALGLPGWLAGFGLASALVFYVPVMTLVRRSRVAPEQQRDARSLIGQPGKVRSMLNPEGFVWVADALWRARSEDDGRVRAGADVVVVGVEGILLRVRSDQVASGSQN